MPRGDLVPGGGEIAEDQFVIGKARVDERLEPAVMLHAIGERAAEERDVIAGLEVKFGLGDSRGGGRQQGGHQQRGGDVETSFFHG